MKRNLRLEKVVASKQLKLVVETEEERRTRLEAFLKSWQLCLSFKLDVQTPTTERNIDHDLLSASLILLDMYLITYTLSYKLYHFNNKKIFIVYDKG